MSEATRLDTEARKLLDVREKHEAADKEAKRLKKEREEQEEVVSELMDELNQPSASLDLGGKYGTWRVTKPKPTIYARVIDKDVALASVQAAGRLEEMFDSTIRKAPANQWIKECIERGEDLPDGFDFSESSHITMTRKKT